MIHEVLLIAFGGHKFPFFKPFVNDNNSVGRLPLKIFSDLQNT